MTDDAAVIREALEHGFISLDDEGRWLKARSEALDALSRMERREARLREALMFYASGSRYKRRNNSFGAGMPHDPEIYRDRGDLARQALASLDEEES